MLASDIERTFDRYRDLLEDLSFPEVRRWKEADPRRKAVGFFPVYAPVEIIHAAGMLPVGLAGAGDRLDIQHADARFGSFICSIIKTTLELGMTGHLEPFEGLLFSSICDSARNLAFVMKRNFPQKYIDFLHLPHNPSSPASVDFLAAEYRRLIGQLERIGGDYSEEKLRAGIALFNRQRELVRELYAIRAAAPHLLRAWECYVAVRVGNVLPVEEHIALLEQVLAAAPRRDAKKRDSLRVVIEGSFCEQPPLEVIRLIEDAGCDIVEDDFTLAQRWFTEDVPAVGDPVHALAEAYVNRSVYSSVRHDFRKPRWLGLAEKIKASQADAVIFLMAKFCEPAYFDYVPFKQQVELMGLPHLALEYEEKLFTFERLRTEVETFVESLVFD
ncbi:MAG: 2-hydroxyacyl-CoA dehydratase [Candidatus Koribacter versatilis]|uniref:2-hydroxyacyl-CoA dehydratase n=1 Tax=Candidatus Korobacter versatilis TaxID=658062 RepID=A0A932EPQ0_9BACT|nr:2-hydroxyacyl-CoA dehydratase [Candidatus Koribacter versatilis]